MINVKSIKTEEPDRNEIARYAGAKNASALSELDECLEKCKGIFKNSVCYDIFDACITDEQSDLGFCRVTSRSIGQWMKGCNKVLVFAASIGLEIDRLIHLYSTVSPAKAVLYQAIGAERIESLCNAFCNDIRNELASIGQIITPRFSPGYGDLDISIQKDIFRALDCTRKIGITLTDSFLMLPTKSVTAIIGIKSGKQ